MPREFKSIEDFQRYVFEQERAANEMLTDGQVELRDDTAHRRYFARRYGGVWIFGEAWSVDEAIDAERAAFPQPMDEEDETEFEYSMAALWDSRRRGYLFGRCYSVMEPRGELGSTHVSTVVPIDHDTFEKARALHWEV